MNKNKNKNIHSNNQTFPGTILVSSVGELNTKDSKIDTVTAMAFDKPSMKFISEVLSGEDVLIGMSLESGVPGLSSYKTPLAITPFNVDKYLDNFLTNVTVTLGLNSIDQVLWNCNMTVDLQSELNELPLLDIRIQNISTDMYLHDTDGQKLLYRPLPEPLFIDKYVFKPAKPELINDKGKIEPAYNMGWLLYHGRLELKSMESCVRFLGQATKKYIVLDFRNLTIYYYFDGVLRMTPPSDIKNITLSLGL